MPKYEVLICNDHSTDKTLIVAHALSKKYPNVRVVSNNGEKGFGNVMRFGFKEAKGKYLVPMMADLCDDPKTVNLMYEKIITEYDVVVGSRYIKGGAKKNVQNHFKSACSWGVGFVGWNLQNIKTHDTTNAFKMMRRDKVLKVKPESNNFDISLELTIKLHKLGCKITEVPTVWIDRTEGISKFKIFKVMRRYIRWLAK